MKKFKTVIIGFGQIAQGVLSDKKMSDFYKYQCHAQVLKKHPNIDWLAVIDPDTNKLKIARKVWKIKNTFRDISELPRNIKPEIAILATKPNHRLDIIKSLPTLKGVIIEKPLSENVQDRKKLIKYCQEKNIKTNVNFTRRFDTEMLKIKDKIVNKLGEVQYGCILYGNGIKNNGVHFIDLIRMLFGKIKSVHALGKVIKNKNFPIDNDYNMQVVLELKNKKSILMCPINFNFYREQYVDIWCDKGRIEIFQEGIFYKLSHLNHHRAIDNENEISLDRSQSYLTKIGVSFYKIYDDLINSIINDIKTFSPLENAASNEEIIDKILLSHKFKKKQKCDL